MLWNFASRKYWLSIKSDFMLMFYVFFFLTKASFFKTQELDSKKRISIFFHVYKYEDKIVNFTIARYMQ